MVPMTTTWTGTVNAPESMFRTDPDGTVRFKPFNDACGAFRTTDHLDPDDRNACILTLEDGEYFQVLEDTNKSDGFGPRSAAGNYLDYRDALMAARGKGVQGSLGHIQIMTLAKVEQITAIDHDGHEVVMGTRPVWRSVDIPSRLVFPNRMAEEQA